MGLSASEALGLLPFEAARRRRNHREPHSIGRHPQLHLRPHPPSDPRDHARKGDSV